MTSSTSSASPLLLAVESSTWTLSLCLSRGVDLIAEEILYDSRNHTELLLPRIDQLLALAGLPLSSIELYAIGLGPGSFTGLRIGLSTLKALAWSQDRPLVGVNSMDALALDPPLRSGWLAVAQDARKKEVYGAIYRVDGFSASRLGPCLVQAPTTLCQTIAARVDDDQPLVLIGSGAQLYRSTFVERFGATAVPPEGHHGHQVRAQQIARLAFERWARGATMELAAIEPEYVRPSEAELGRKNRTTT
ncbi:MAG: tRNA (adenosine(37)-N6)-threonylcarbamoyltransferase complex dimerization subunit type 1 TsaB [Myxococcales bacterium]|nr:tRNA (adenosine(37)-N6)-threonylcarbamoyltransferase complex dimerization subunit type 1 TsaB [Myxococcales bacterium]